MPSAHQLTYLRNERLPPKEKYIDEVCFRESTSTPLIDHICEPLAERNNNREKNGLVMRLGFTGFDIGAFDNEIQ